MSGDLSAKNDLLLNFADEYPGRVLPYCTLSSNEPERVVPELERCLSEAPCIGVKMHRYDQRTYTVRSDFLQPVFEILDEERLVYLNHVFVSHEDLEWAAERYPNITFLSGHGVDAAVNDLACRYKNIKDCTCAAMSLDEVGKEIERIGRSDTMLVGSDFALFSLAFGIGMIAFAGLAEPQKRAIMGGNALEVLNHSPAHVDIVRDIKSRYTLR
jgi:predicted TIM-barrel fold metal-dependent hydrolase